MNTPKEEIVCPAVDSGGPLTPEILKRALEVMRSARNHTPEEIQARMTPMRPTATRSLMADQRWMNAVLNTRLDTL